MTRLTRTIRRHAPIFVGVAPLGAVLVATFIGPALGPARTLADDSETGDQSAPALEPLPAKALAARDAAAAALEAPMGVSPFVRAPAVGSGGEADPASIATPGQAPGFSVSAILADRRGGPAMAVVNGKVRREGDVIAPGWAVERIDVASGEVWFVGDDGRRVAASTRKR